MTSHDSDSPRTDVPAEVEALRPTGDRELNPDLTAGELSERCGRLYGPIAVALGAVAFLPPFDRGGSVLELMGEPEGVWAVLGFVVLAVLVWLLVIAAISPDASVARPAWIVGLSITTAVLLCVKPGAGLPPPHLSDSGTVAVVLLVGAAIIGAAHAGLVRS